MAFPIDDNTPLTPLQDLFPLPDTGWITPSLGTGYSTGSTGPQQLQYRRIGSLVHWKGEVWGSPSSIVLLNVPSGFRPASRVARVVRVPGTSTVAGKLNVQNNYDLEIREDLPSGSPGFSFTDLQWITDDDWPEL